jgi:hypothetical protein
MGDKSVKCVWDPDVPDPRKLSLQEWKQYATERDALFAEIGIRAWWWFL